MLQRGIALLVIVGFLASQLAAIPHAHSCYSTTQQQKHDSTPHVHLSWLGSSHHHHDHLHGGRPHSHPHVKHHGSTPVEKHDDSAPIQDSEDHDASAISIAVPLGLPISSSQATAGTETSQLPAIAVPIVCHSDLSRFQPICWHPPDSAWADSHLYLSLRNLRL